MAIFRAPKDHSSLALVEPINNSPTAQYTILRMKNPQRNSRDNNKKQQYASTPRGPRQIIQASTERLIPSTFIFGICLVGTQKVAMTLNPKPS